LGLAAPILKALEQEGYQSPTPIQAQAIPPLMEGRDLLGIAQTGTGKTAAFALPILNRIANDPKPAPRHGARVLVLSPTRELASQIAESFEAYGRHLNIRVAVIFGGVGYRPQRDALNRGLDVLVATPGRLLDHIAERTADLRNTEVLVLDEADQMLDLGFIKPIRDIVSGMSKTRQNLLFSATMPREIAGLADQLLSNPVKVAVTPVSSTVERVTQRVIFIDQARKRSLLAELMADPALTRGLVFTRTKRGADRVAKHLEVCGVKTAAIHGNKSQNQRESALEAFRDGRIRVLVATDIAARGIDVSQVSHVVNFELPEVPEVYVHRIGRTARAGASGIAISLCGGDERDLLRAIERTTRQTIPSEDRRGDAALEADSVVPRDRNEDRNARGRGRSGGEQRGSAQGARPSRPAQSRRRDDSTGPTRSREGGDRVHGARDNRERAASNGSGNAGPSRNGSDRQHQRNGDRPSEGARGGEQSGAALGHMRFFKPRDDARRDDRQGRADRPDGRGRDRGQGQGQSHAQSFGEKSGRPKHRRGKGRPAGPRVAQPVG